MKILIDEIDDYPVYSFNKDINNRCFETEIEVPEEQVVEWERVMKDYKRIQKEMHAALLKKISIV